MTESPTPPVVDDGPAFPVIPHVDPAALATADESVTVVEAVTLLLDVVRGWHAEMTRYVAAGRAPSRSQLEAVGTLRRNVSVLADLVARREVGGREAVITAQHAARVAERTTGLAIRAGQAAGTVRAAGGSAADLLPGDIGGSATGECLRLADVTSEQFAAAVDVATDRGGPTFERVDAALDDTDLPAALKRQRGPLVELAGRGYTSTEIGEILDVAPGRVRELAYRFGIEVPGDDVPAAPVDVALLLPEFLSRLRELAAVAQSMVGGLDQLTPAQAADAATAVWDPCKFIVHFQVGLANRSRG
jgi:hypothetical protein